MTFIVEAFTSGDPSPEASQPSPGDARPLARFEISDGRHTLGSGPACDLVLPHPEMPSTAATVEVSSDAVFFGNQNEFAVFVGADSVGPGEVAEWRVGVAVQLTRNIALTLASATEGGLGETELATEKSQHQTLIQVGVIALCAVLVAFQLTQDTGPVAQESETVVGFDELIEQFEQAGGKNLTKLSREHRVMMRYLAEARAVESRWGGRDNELARKAYEMILSAGQNASTGSDDPLIDLTQQYAASRIERLR